MRLPSAGDSNARSVFAALLLLCALGFLAYRLYSTSRPQSDARLFLSDDIRLNPVPDAPESDKNSLKHQLENVAELSVGIRSTPNDARKWLDYAQAAIQAGDNLSGRAALLHVIEKWSPDDSAVYDALSTCTRELGLLAEAETAARKEIALEPAALEGYVNLSKVFIQRNQPVQAKQALIRAAGEVPNSDLKARLELSRHFDDRQDPVLALKEAESALRIAPSDPGAQLAVANLVLKQGRLDEAAAMLKRIERENSNISNLHRLFGVLYSSPGYTGKDLKLAEHHYLRSIELDDSNLRAVAGLSGILFQQQKFKQAAFAYGRLLELDRSNASARFNLAQCYARLGDSVTSNTQREIAADLLKWQERLAYLKGQRSAHLDDPSKRIPLAEHFIVGGHYADALLEIQSACALSGNKAEFTGRLRSLYGEVGAPISTLLPL